VFGDDSERPVSVATPSACSALASHAAERDDGASRFETARNLAERAGETV